jgi:hypothetical protein
MSGVRVFDLRDSLAVQKLIGRGVSLDSRTQLTQGLHVLRRAFLGNVLPDVRSETVMADRAGRTIGFAQMMHRRGAASANLRFIAPREIFSDDAGTALIEELLRAAGRRRAQHILADAEEKSDAFSFLRRICFSVYAREEIWTAVPPFPQVATPPGVLRPLLDGDASSMQGLYCSLVPALVYQVEGLPRRWKGWMIYEEGELVGFFRIQSGRLGLWMEPFFHPEARRAADWIGGWLGGLPPERTDPVYVCVRSYQEWLGPILSDFGFSRFGRRAVLVRRVVIPVPVRESVTLPAVENPAAGVTTFRPTSVSHTYDSATTNHR